MQNNNSPTCTTNEYGDKSWYLNRRLHRIDGPAYEAADGSKQWFRNGKRHRLDGPAIECANGHKEWYRNGKKHRADGPAVEWASGIVDWWFDNHMYKSISAFCDAAKMTPEEKTLFLLKWAK